MIYCNSDFFLPDSTIQHVHFFQDRLNNNFGHIHNYTLHYIWVPWPHKSLHHYRDHPYHPKRLSCISNFRFLFLVMWCFCIYLLYENHDKIIVCNWNWFDSCSILWAMVNGENLISSKYIFFLILYGKIPQNTFFIWFYIGRGHLPGVQ